MNWQPGEQAETCRVRRQDLRELLHHFHRLDDEARQRGIPPVDHVSLSQAASDILAERRRQIDAEGFSIEHDDTHTAGEMAFAAACYAASGAVDEAQRGKDDRLLACIQFIWPKAWAWGWWTPKNRRRDLVRAGALILAEIERLDRAALALSEGRS